MKREEADMDYLDLEAPGLTAGNVEKIAALFPAAVTETRGADGKVKKAVNFEVLKQLLAPDVAEGRSAMNSPGSANGPPWPRPPAPPPEPSAP